MVSATIDHMISITIFLAALLLFINMFGQTNQNAIIYQQHRAIATKCSDLLDSMLLTPGSPSNWSCQGSLPNGFGLQDPEFTQYRLSPFSAMRLQSAVGSTVSYAKTNPEVYYRNVTDGFGNSLLTPLSDAVNYSLASRLLGVNGTYGFEFVLAPTLNLDITQTNPANPLRLSIYASGNGFPFAYASVSYCLLQVTLPSAPSEYPSYVLLDGATSTDDKGFSTVEFPEVTDANQAYALVAYVHLNGLVGVGCYKHATFTDQHVVPVVSDTSQQKVLLAHSYDFNDSSPVSSSLKYNATFVVLTEDFSLREMPVDSANTTGIVTSGLGNPYINLTIPTFTPGILIVPYQLVDDPSQGGVVMMPWGLSSLAFSVTFGGDPRLQEWVATDLRQVTINRVTYQAKLSLWSSIGLQEVS